MRAERGEASARRLGLGGGGTGKEGSRVELGERVGVASSRAGGRSSARAPGPAPLVPPPSGSPSSRLAMASASLDPARAGNPVPKSGRGVPQLETCLLPSSRYSLRPELLLPRRGAEGI